MLELTQPIKDQIVKESLRELAKSIEHHLVQGYIEYPEEIAKHHKVLRATNTLLEFYGDYDELA